jgi:hypothetical protein
MKLWPLLLIVGTGCPGESPREAVVERTPAPAVAAVEPAPPVPVRLAVSPRSADFDALGDTLRLSLPAGVACESAMPSVATVDASGLVRSVMNGATQLHCRGDHATAMVKVTTYQKVARIAITTEQGLEIARAGDTLRLGLARVDRLGTTVANVRPDWASLHPDVLRVDAASGVAVGVVDSGTARVVARVDGLTDTVTVELGRRAKVVPLLMTSSRGGNARVVRNAALRRAATPIAAARRSGAGPVADRRFAAPGIGARGVLPSDSLDFQDPTVVALARRGRVLNPYAVLMLADHGVSDQGGQPLERSSGMMFGAGIAVETRSWLRASAQVSTGTLAAQTAASREQKVTDGRIDLGVAAFPWLTLTAGVQSRVYKDISATRWVMVRTGGDLRYNLGATPLSGVASLSVLPVISRGKGNTSPSFGINTAVGVGFEQDRFSVSLKYFVERYGFPAQAGLAAREEQFTGLEFRLGLFFGW